MKVLVTGAAGQLGGAIVREFARGHGGHGGHGGHDVVALTRQQLDLTDHERVLGLVGEARPSVIVNCAGYNDVDGAEEAAVDALTVNALAVRSLARAAAAAGATLVHYSTDFVFDGTATTPYVEEHRPNPQSIYAMSKLMGEWFATDAPRHYVLRVESLFGGLSDRSNSVRAKQKSSVDRIVDAIVDDREARVFVDRVVSPAYVDDVATATRAIVERGPPEGLYHCVNSGMATWLELAGEVARQLGREGRLVPISVADVRQKARRPKFCALSNGKLASVGVAMPTWQDGLTRYLTARNLPQR